MSRVVSIHILRRRPSNALSRLFLFHHEKAAVVSYLVGRILPAAQVLVFICILSRWISPSSVGNRRLAGCVCFCVYVEGEGGGGYLERQIIAKERKHTATCVVLQTSKGGQADNQPREVVLYSKTGRKQKRQ